MSFQAVQQRWDGFLSKIESRFEEILQQAHDALPTLIDYTTFDVLPLMHAWGGIGTQLKELTGKISDTWENQVEEAFEKVEKNNKQIEQERLKGEDLEKRLERRLQQFEITLKADISRQMQKRATEILSKEFLCTQCKAPLEIEQNFYRSYYKVCSYCQTTNTFEPGTIARNIEHFALHALAEEAAIEENFAYQEISGQYSGQRSDRPKSIKKEAVIDAYRKYVEKYLKKRIEIIPDYEKRYDEDLQGKVEQVSKWLY